MLRLWTSVRGWRKALWLAEGKEGSSQNIKVKNSISPSARRTSHPRTNRDSGRCNIREAGPYAVRRGAVRWADAFDERIEALPYPCLLIAWKREFLDQLQRWTGRAAGGAVTGDRVEAILLVQRKRVEETDEASACAGRVMLYWAIGWVQPGWALVILPLPYSFKFPLCFVFHVFEGLSS